MRIKFQCCSDVGKCCDTLGSVKLATLRPIINQNNTQQRDASVNTKCQHHKAIKVSTTSNVLTERGWSQAVCPGYWAVCWCLPGPAAQARCRLDSLWLQLRKCFGRLDIRRWMLAGNTKSVPPWKLTNCLHCSINQPRFTICLSDDFLFSTNHSFLFWFLYPQRSIYYIVCYSNNPQ